MKALIWEAEELTAHFRIIAQERANVIHPLWAIHSETGNVHRELVSARRELKKSFDQHPVEEIRILAEAIEQLAARTSRFYIIAVRWKGPLPAGMSRAEFDTTVAGMRAAIQADYAAFLAAKDQAAKNKVRKLAHAEASRADPNNEPRKK